MLVGFGLCVLRIFQGYINWLHYSCFVLLSRLFHIVCPLICVLAVCRGHSNWLDTLVLFR